MLDTEIKPRTILGLKSDSIYDNLHLLHEVIKKRGEGAQPEQLPIMVTILTERSSGFMMEALFDEFCAEHKGLNYDVNHIVELMEKEFINLKCRVSFLSREAFDHEYIGEEDFQAIPMELGLFFNEVNHIYFNDIPLDVADKHKAKTHGHLHRSRTIAKVLEATALDNTVIMTRLHDDVHVRTALANVIDDFI